MAGRRRPPVTVDLRLPGLRLVMRPKPIMGAAARAVATEARKMLRRGRKVGGGDIRKGKDSGKALRDSGKLIRSIKGRAVRTKNGWIAMAWAQGQRDDLGSSLKGRQGGLLAVQLYGQRSEEGRPRNAGLMSAGPEVEKAAVKAFERALQKQLDSGRARVVGQSEARGVGSRLFGGGG